MSSILASREEGEEEGVAKQETVGVDEIATEAPGLEAIMVEDPKEAIAILEVET